MKKQFQHIIAKEMNLFHSYFPFVRILRDKALDGLLAFCLLMLSAPGFAQNVNVNPGAGSYPTLKDAFDAINLGTHTGAITIDIVGNTTEAASAVLNASGTGAASYTSVLIQPSGGGSRTITGTLALALIDFSGADNVTIDGLNSGGNSLTISNTSNAATSGTCTIRFIGGATNNTVTRCTVLGSFSAAVGTNGGNIYFATDAVTASGNDNNTISFCDIGPAGANLPTKGIYGNGSTTTTAIGNSGININHNNFFDIFGAAVASACIYTGGGCNTWSITSNNFYQTGTRTWTTGANHRGIDINNSTSTSGAQGFTITGNIIGYASNIQTGTYTLTGSTGKFVGIQFTGITLGTSSTISSNTIANVSLSGVTSSGTSTSSPFTGILIGTGVAVTSSNTIGSQATTGSLIFSTTSTSSTDVMGIYNFSSDVWTANSNNIGGISVTNAAASGTYVIYGLRANTGTSVSMTATSNYIGGTVANSIQLSATGTSSQVIGIHSSNAPAIWTSNTIRNLTNNIGTGTTTAASVIGMNITTSTPNHTLSQNTIFNLSNTNATAASVVTGIQFTGSTANIVERNKIYGLTVSSTSATAEINGIRVGGGTTTYRNNMIAVGAGVANANLINGINEPLAGTDQFFHNSVYIGGAPSAGTANSFAFNSTQTTNTRSFRDNIFVNARSNSGATGKNYCVQVGGTLPNPTGLTINNNVYYITGTGTVFGRFNALDVVDLPAWKTAVGQDAGSFQSDPKYNDPTNATPDLHIHPTNVTVVEGNGFSVGVTDDYDGQTRASFTPTDIGADAGDFVGIDLSGPVISYTNLSNTTSTSDRTTTSFATITDPSLVNVTPGTAPRIYYKKSSDANNTFNDNTSATVGWKYAESTTGSSPFDFTIDYSLLNNGPVVVGDVIQYFVVAQDLAGTPNVSVNSGTFTAQPASVALTSAAFPIGGSINSYSVLTAISGTITVPGTYPSLTLAGGAFASINAAVVTGDINIEITADLTLETGLNALNAFNSPYTIKIYPTGAARIVSGTTSSAALIKLNGADRVTMDGSIGGTGTDKSLTITNTSATSPTAVSLSSLGTGAGATNNTIKNCNINTGSNAAASYGIAIGGSTPGTAGDDNDNNTIQNNTVTKAYYGIYAAANSTGVNDNLSITGNTIGSLTSGSEIQFTGILVAQATAAAISSNSITNILTALSIDPIGINLSTGVINSAINANAISGVNATSSGGYGGRGIQINTGNAASNLTISNNVISDIKGTGWSSLTSDAIMGIAIGNTASTTGGIKLYYNAVNLGSGTFAGNSSGTLSAALAIAASGASGLDIRNNIFSTNLVNSAAASAKTYAIYSAAANTAFTNINYNDYFVSGAQGVLGFLTSDRVDLAGIQAGFGQNVNSIVANPSYQSSTDLRPGLGSPVIGAGNNSGTGITTDYLGVTRSSGTPPTGSTIGAYENAVDASGPAISYTNLSNTTSTSDRTTSSFATITDPSIVDVTPGTAPRIYYKKSTDANNTFNDNTSATVGWKYAESPTGSSPFDFTIDYSLLNNGPVIVGDVIQYFVVAQDQAGTPNVSINSGTFAAPPTSVDLTGAAFPIGGTINSYSVLAAISGTITVPGTYASLTLAGGAFAALNASVATGDITIEITGDLTGETGANQLNEIASPYTLTIKPTGAAWAISGSSASGLITLNAADRITIDGSLGSTVNSICSPTATATRDLTITNTNTGTSSAVVWLQSSGANGATNNVVKNCNLVGNGNTLTLFGVGSGSSIISTSSLGTGNNNNSFINNNITRTQNGIYSQGASAANKNTGTVINQNLINSTSADNIQICGIRVGFENGITISGNSIAHLSGSSTTVGISLGVLPSNSYTSFTGNEVTGATVTKNIIDDIVRNGDGTALGISVSAVSTVGASANLIANNMISGVRTTTATPSDFPAGILIGGGTQGATNVYYNTISLSGSGSSSSPGFGIAIGGSNPIADLRNNIFVNTMTSSSGKMYAIGLAYSTYSNLTSNNNDFFTTASPLAVVGGFSNTPSGDQANLSGWQSVTGKDGASKNISPVFLTPAPNLHIDGTSPANYQLNNTADGTTGITDDIDCNTRATDIGGDEFDFTACNGAVGGTAAAVGPTTLCGPASVTINATGYSSGTGSTYEWERSTDNFVSNIVGTGVTTPATFSTGTISTTSTKYYRLRVQCSSNSSTAYSNIITITVNVVTASVTPLSQSVCAGTEVTINENAGTGTSWSWNPGGATTQTIMVTPLLSTTYTVTVTGAGACTATASSAITVNEYPVISTGTYGPVCVTEPDVTLSATPPGGAWTGTGVTGNIFDPSAGTQTLTYSITENDCSSSAQTTITVNANMNWVFLPPGSTNGTCTSETNCCSDILCYGLQYTPAHTGTLTSYTTGFFVNCVGGVGGDTSVLSNTSCVMTNNSPPQINDCAGSGMVLFNSSGNTGAVAVVKGVPIILHKVCFNVPVGETLTITEDLVTSLTTSLDVGDDFINEFSCFAPFEISRSAPTVPPNGSGTVACASLAVAPSLPVVLDQCGTTLTGVLTGTLDVPEPVTCEGTREYTYVFTDCSDLTSAWTYTYTIEYAPFTDPADGGSTVSCPAATDTPPALPTVLDNCGNTLTPTGPPVVSDPVECEGTRTYTYTYTDCELNTQDWVYTYTVESDPIPNPTDGGSTVACPAATDVEPTAFLPIVVDNCGNTLSPSEPVVSDPVECEGTRTYTYTYTDCALNTQDWVYTYIVDLNPFVDPTDDGITVTYPYETNVEPTSYLPVVVDNCGNILTPSEAVTSDPIVCDGTRTYTYTYTDCALNTQDWVFTYTVPHSVIVTNTDDSGDGSLRNIVACALNGETITFSTSLQEATIYLTSGEIEIDKDLTIIGLGIDNLTISGTNNSRIFHIDPGKTVTLQEMALRDAFELSNGGAIYVEAGSLTLENIQMVNNFEGATRKGITVIGPGTVEIIGVVEIKE